MSSFTKADYKRIALIARGLHTHVVNPRNYFDFDYVDKKAAELMKMVESCIGQLPGPRWWDEYL